jgi:thiol-disulfide isomerase/thioredoxin
MKILKFGAIWCSSCLVMNPLWSDIKNELPWIDLIELDYDNDKDKVEEWSVTSTLPTIIFVDNNNNELMRFFGEKPKHIMVNAIHEYKEK